MMANRIVLLADRLDRQKTGLEHYFDQLAAGLRRCAPAGEWEFEMQALRPRLAKLSPARRLRAYLFGVDIDQLGIEADLVHTLIPLPVRTRRPLVTTVHDLIPFHYPEGYPWYVGVLYAAALQRLNVDGAHFVTNSRATADDLAALAGVAWDRIDPVPLGLPDFFVPTPEANRKATCERFGLEGFFFLFVGALHKRKNLGRLLEAFAQVSHRHPDQLTLALTGRSGWNADEFGQLAERLGVRDRVRWLDYVPHEELASLIGAAGAVVYPSLYEGFGFPPLEAMACGTVAVCSDIGALRETAGSAAIGVDPYSIASIAEGLAQAIEMSEPARKRRISAGIAWAKQFEWTTTAEKTLEIYRRLLGDTDSPRASRASHAT